MQIRTATNSEKREALDALVIPFWKLPASCEPAVELSDRLKELVLPPIQIADFTAKDGEVVWLYSKELEQRVALLGLGVQEKVSVESLRRSFFKCMRAMLDKKAKSANIFFPHFHPLDQAIGAKGAIEGLFFGSYVFDALKHDVIQDEPAVRPEEVVLITHEAHATQEIAHAAQKVMQALFFARDLINGNADDVTPQFLGECAKKMAERYPRIDAHVHGKKWIEEQKMGLIQAVSKGTDVAPVFIELHYKGDPVSKDHTVLVGKGITYDTGGLNLKPTGSMETMRADMGGAAICLATLQAVAALELPCNVSVVIPSCENAIGSRAYKPGDVYKSYTGKTIEITNTDAEGRLVLADALAYTARVLKPTRIIDLATLTAAMDIAVGFEAIGFFSNSDSFAEELTLSGARTYERAWRFPLFDEYKDKLKSDVADMKNAAGRSGGAILAATFLHQFVGTTPWAHFDIAGCSFSQEATRYWPKNATGIGVRLLVDYFIHLVQR